MWSMDEVCLICDGGIIQVARLQEQLQTERDLRAALEIGLSMSAAQLSAAQSLDSKVCILKVVAAVFFFVFLASLLRLACWPIYFNVISIMDVNGAL